MYDCMDDLTMELLTALLEQDNRVAEDFDAGRFVRESLAP